MTRTPTLIAGALMISAAPAFAQSVNNEVGALSFNDTAAQVSANSALSKQEFAAVETQQPIALADTQTSFENAPRLAFSADPETVSRNSDGRGGTRDWTGFYVGGQLGYLNLNTNLTGSNDEFIGGIFAGYDYDLGDWVIGAGLDNDFASADIDGTPVELENVFRVRGRLGYKIGEGLLYGTAGYAVADTNILGSDDGYFIGAGYEHFVTQNVTIGGEILYHDFNNFNSSGIDVEATTVQVRATFRF